MLGAPILALIRSPTPARSPDRCRLCSPAALGAVLVLGAVPLFLVPTPGILVVALVFAGLALGSDQRDTLLASRVAAPEGTETESTAWVVTAFAAGAATGAAVAGVMIEEQGIRWHSASRSSQRSFIADLAYPENASGRLEGRPLAMPTAAG
jgi:predicted MFS family arabinose efflux permease